MKIRYEERENISNSSQNSRKFKLSEDPSATLNIIQILTENLYTNPKRSAIRETLANAIDASVEKNNKLNIKTPPRIDVYITNDEINNSFLYFLNIKDYGIGINEERMENYLSKIGNSSKRDSDEQIGALGIGVCTLFCIGEQVFIESYITDDNNRTEKIKYLLYKDKVGIPCYDLKEKEYIGEKREESYTIIKILLEGEDILNTVIKYILENCCLIDIDLYTNIKSLVLLSSYIKKYKKKNNNFRFLESYYLIKKDKDFIEKKEISSNNNNYYYNNRFKQIGNYKEDYLNRFLILERELDITRFKERELIQYHSKEVFNIKEEEYIYKLLSNEGIFEEKENLIIMMGDSLYNIKIETLTNTFRGKILKEELDKLESIKYLYNNKNVQLVLRVPIGSIKFSSNREYIVLENEKTQDYLLQCIKEFFEDYKKKFIDKLKKYKNIKIEDLFELDLYTKENTHLLNIKGIYIRELDLKVITSSELKTYHTFNELNLWEEPFIVNKNKIKEDIKEENNILIIDKNNIIYEKINDEIIYHEDLKIKLNNKNYLDVDNIYGILKDYNTFLVGPTEELQLDTLIKDRLSKSIKTGIYIKKKISLLLSDTTYIKVRKKIIKELIEKNKLKIVVSNISQVSKIRKEIKEVKNEPFILLYEENSTQLEVIKNSIAFNLIDSIFYLNKKSSDKNKKKVEENKEEYKPFNNSILLSRVYNKEKLEEIILKKKDYTDKTIYDITEQLKENIEKESKLRKVIIYEISSSQRLTYDQLLEHWFIEKLLELNVIKNEQNKINKIIFLTETSFNYIKERLSNKYKLKSVKKVYRQVINIIYKNDKDSIDKLISLNSNTTRIYNSYRDYKIIRNNSIIFSYLEIYCILGQIEKILTEEQIKVYNSIYELSNIPIINNLKKITNNNELKFEYKEKENTVFYKFLNRLIYKLVYSIRNLKGYNKKKEEAQVNVIFWLFENNNHIEELNIIDKLLEYNENLLNNETGLLKDFYKNLIKKIIKASK